MGDIQPKKSPGRPKGIPTRPKDKIQSERIRQITQKSRNIVIPGGVPVDFFYSNALSDDRKRRYQMLAGYEQDLLNGKDELALLKSLLYELVEKLNTYEAGIHWQKAREALANFHLAMAKGASDPVKSAQGMEIALNDLETALAGGNEYYGALNEIKGLTGLIGSLREREVKRVTSQDNTLTIAMAQSWLMSVATIIAEEVEDDEVKKRIAQRLRDVTKTAFPQTQPILIGRD